MKRFKPAIEFNYWAATRVYSVKPVKADQILVAVGTRGLYAACTLADASMPALSNGRLLVTKHASAGEGEGLVVCLPWKRSNPTDTSSLAEGAPIFLGTDGCWTGAPPANGSFTRQVGRVLRSHKTEGCVEFDFTAESDHASALTGAHAKPVASNDAAGSLPMMYRLPVVPSSEGYETDPMGFSMQIVDVWVVVGGKKKQDSGSVVVFSGAKEIAGPLLLANQNPGSIVRAETISPSYSKVREGSILKIKNTGKARGTVYVLAYRA
jgi:hypothetical protein